jgi:hypothetical protein
MMGARWRRGDRPGQWSRPDGPRVTLGAPIVPFVAAAAGVLLLLLADYARTWRSLSAAVAVCPRQFCDFVDYYYPMGEAIFRTGLPAPGFLYSPFIAILLAVFPPLGLDASLVVWGVLQVLSVSLCVLLFRWLVPAGLSIQLLFVALTLFSYPTVLNVMGGQVSIFMMAALLGLLVLYERGRPAAAAGLLAFAVSFKFYPAIFLAPFVARRDTRFVLLAAGALGGLLFVIPGVLLGVGDTLRFYGALFESFRDSGWVVTNPHSQFFPHVVVRLAAAAGYDASTHLPLLHVIACGVAAANLGVVILVQRARLRHADVWCSQLVFLTIPFILKTSWPHDFVFLPFTQASLAWRLLERKAVVSGIGTGGERSYTGARRDRVGRASAAVTSLLLLASTVASNAAFFHGFGSFPRYGFFGFLLWADLLLLTASYLVLLPPALGRLCGADVQARDEMLSCAGGGG